VGGLCARRVALWPRGHGLHQDTLLGNSDAIAGATLTALWVFLLPIFKELLSRRKQQKVVKAYFFLAFVYIRYYQPTPTFKRWLRCSLELPMLKEAGAA
jgi:hypothetical protein